MGGAFGRRDILKLALATFALIALAFTTSPAADNFIIVQSTTSTQNSGLFEHILPLFTKKTGIEVRVVAPSDEGRGGEDELDSIPVRRVRSASPRGETLAYRGTMQAALRAPSGIRALVGLWRALRHAADEEAKQPAPAG